MANIQGVCSGQHRTQCVCESAECAIDRRTARVSRRRSKCYVNASSLLVLSKATTKLTERYSSAASATGLQSLGSLVLAKVMTMSALPHPVGCRHMAGRPFAVKNGNRRKTNRPPSAVGEEAAPAAATSEEQRLIHQVLGSSEAQTHLFKTVGQFKLLLLN